MRKNKMVKRLAAAVMTAAMVMSMGGMSAFAAETNPATEVEESVAATDESDAEGGAEAEDGSGETGEGTESMALTIKDNKIELTKVISKDTNALLPNTTFSFTITPVGTENVAIEGYTDPVVYGGVSGGAYFAQGKDTITVTPDTQTLTTEISLNASVFTAKPGVFRYEIAESAGNYDGMTYATNKYYLDLYVENNVNGEGKNIYAAVAYNVSSNGIISQTKSNSVTFTNDYETHKLTVTKTITGNQANMSETFKFKIIINGTEGEKYATNYVIDQAKDEYLVLESGTVSAEFELGHGQSIEVYGLSENDTYTVVEVDANKDGYTTTYYNGEIKPDNKKVAITTIAEGTTDNVVNVVNDKQVNTPTGIVMNIAPYLLMVAVAGVFAVMFLRRRREEY